jgi:predicted RNA-binding Zn-ribbon protein involved in translation (DUF1610 family)
VAEAKRKMSCTDCRIEMNHHSDKLVYAADLPQSDAIDPSQDVIEEFYACPKCGGIASRRGY